MSNDPSKTTSEEVDQRQLELASEEGEAYQRSLEYMVNEVAHSGDTKETGEFIVGYAQEKAEGMYAPTGDGGLEWTEPSAENCHIEVAVCDATDKRFIPNLAIQATLTSEDGDQVGPFEVPFLWHPGLFHYGRNVEVPGNGRYTLDVTVDPPSFKRHDEKNGDRYAEGVSVTFEDVDIQTGQG